MLLARLRMWKIFGRVEQWLFVLPCIGIALNNFQWVSFFQGKMRLVTQDGMDFLLFALYCLSIALFEELVFRGVIFSLLLTAFPKDKKGFLWAYVSSCFIFGLAHLFNGFSGATFLQVGYTVLTGGLFAFCLMKTKNILCPVFVHGLYNFCGLLYDRQGLGAGVVFTWGTAALMAAVAVLLGAFVLYQVWKYSDEEREALYRRLEVK